MYTLVIVDDEPAIAEGICRLLDWKSLGFERIRTARSCFEVVSHVVDWNPGVCLVDVRIGNEFGYELINCLNGMGVKSNYIMMSGYDDFQYACEALRCGADRKHSNQSFPVFLVLPGVHTPFSIVRISQSVPPTQNSFGTSIPIT